MSDYTPNMNVAKAHYTGSRYEESQVASIEEADAEFDRFIAKVKADALREAAGDWRKHLHDTEASYSCAESWLNARADRIEGEA